MPRGKKTEKARRGRGEGAVFQREDGRWVAEVTLPPDMNGKRRRKTVYGSNKSEALERKRELEAEIHSGAYIEPSKMMLSEFLGKWLEDSARPAIRRSTYVSYESIVRLHINPYMGGIQLSKLTPIQVQSLYSTLEKEGRSPRTRELVHAVLHRAFRQAVRWGLMARNVCDAVDKPRVPKKPMKTLSPDQTRRFLEVSADHRLHALFVMAVTTGMRLGELLGLAWQHVDLKEGTVSVVQSLSNISGEFHLEEPKTEKGRRLIALPEIAIKALKSHRERMFAEGNLGEIVFCSREGTYIHKTNLTRFVFRPLLKEAGLPIIRFHELRHTAATLLLIQGEHPKVVQERLGHSQISVTLDTYSHTMPSMQRDAARKLDDLLAGNNS